MSTPTYLAGLGLFAFTLHGCDNRTASPSGAVRASAGRVLALSPVVDLGVIPAGGAKDHLLRFSNRSPEPLTLDSIETSCACTGAVPIRRMLQPSDGSFLRIRIDLAHQAGFVGDMTVHVRGYEERGIEILRLDVKFSVVPPRELSEGAGDLPIEASSVWPRLRSRSVVGMSRVVDQDAERRR